MIQFWMSMKPNLCQRHFLTLKSLRRPLVRDFSVRNIAKPLLTVRTKVSIGVITFSGCAGYIYLSEFKNITNLIPTAHCESIQQHNETSEKKSIVDSTKNHDISDKERFVYSLQMFIYM